MLDNIQMENFIERSQGILPKGFEETSSEEKIKDYIRLHYLHDEDTSVIKKNVFYRHFVYRTMNIHIKDSLCFNSFSKFEFYSPRIHHTVYQR